MFEIELFPCVKMDLALNNLQWLMYHQTKPNKTKILVNIHNPNSERWLKLVSIISNYSTKTQFFQLIWLLSQISANNLQDPLFKVVFLDNLLYLYSLLVFFNKTSSDNFSKIINSYILKKRNNTVQKKKRKK